MRFGERHLAAIALVACLFLPYYEEVRRVLSGGLSSALALLLGGGPLPVVSAAACAMAVVLLVTNPRGARGPAIGWLAFWFLGLGIWWFDHRADRFRSRPFPWWAWTVALLAGVWVLSVALRAPPRRGQRTDVSAFD